MSSYLSKKTISLLAPLMTKAGFHHVARPFWGGLGHILMFHRIVPENNQSRIHNHLSIEITPEHFERTIKYFINKKYVFISLETLYQYIKRNEFPSKKVLVITFDDGYLDNYELAYPMLKKYLIPFTIYITTGIPNKTAILWWYLLEDLVRDNEVIEFSWNKHNYQFNCSTIHKKEKVYSQIQGIIHENFSIDSYHRLLSELFKEYRHEFYEHTIQKGMTWGQVIALSKDPLVTIGAHTDNHFPLAKLTREDATLEILKSKEELESRLDQPVEHFAYPFGKLIQANHRDYEIVKSLDFKTATTTEIGNLYKENSFALNSLPRININRVTDYNVLNLQTSGLLPFIINRGKIRGK